MIDLNNGEVQGTGSGAGAIPPDSVVLLLMQLREPKPGKEGTTGPFFSRSEKGNEYLDCEFQVMGKSFEGKKLWEMFTLVGNEMAAKISMRTLRAIVESARHINPTDASPNAQEGRKLSDWSDLNNLIFACKVDAKAEQNSKDGKWYVNNKIKRIVVPGDEEYDIVFRDGEVLSDKPLPSCPENAPAAAKPAAAASAPAWGSGTSMLPPTAAPAATNGAPIPAWAAKK